MMTLMTTVDQLHPGKIKLLRYLMLLVTALVLLIKPSVGLAAGLTAFPVLLELTEPRALALGGATVSDRGWSDGTLINPASAAGAPRMASINYASHMLDLWSGRILANYQLPSEITVGGYITTFNYGDFDETVAGVGTGESFSASENILGVYAAGEIGENLSWGGAVKFLWGSIGSDGASGQAIDLGITFDPHWEDLQLGAAIRNLGSQNNGYGSDTYQLPTEILIGGARQLKGLPLTLRVNTALTRSNEGTWTVDFLPGEPGLNVAAGGEFRIVGEGWKEPMMLRFGYRSISDGLRVGNDDDMLAGLSIGVGLPIKSFRLDYAFAAYGSLGDVHRFGFSSRF